MAKGNKGHGDLGSAISASRKYVKIITQIEVELEAEVAQLEREKGYMLDEIDRLWSKVRKAEKNCQDPDSPEAMAGETHFPPMNPDGSPS